MVHVTLVNESGGLLPFRIELKAGEPISEQVVYAVEKAILTGLLKPAMKFPSIRAISQDLRIHPNTTLKAITALVDEGFLEVQPGIGTIIAKNIPTSRRRIKDLQNDMERLILQAKRMCVDCEDLKRILEQQWNKLSNE